MGFSNFHASGRGPTAHWKRLVFFFFSLTVHRRARVYIRVVEKVISIICFDEIRLSTLVVPFNNKLIKVSTHYVVLNTTHALCCASAYLTIIEWGLRLRG